MENTNNSALSSLVSPFLNCERSKEFSTSNNFYELFGDIYHNSTVLSDDSYKSTFIKIRNSQDNIFNNDDLNSYFLYWNISQNENSTTNFIEKQRNIVKTKLDTEKRLERLLTFQGDDESGFEKPSSKALSNVSVLLRQLLNTEKLPAAPIISVAPDGEILVSWRTQRAYFLLSFEDTDNLEWVFKNKKIVSGVWDLTHYNSISMLAKTLLQSISDFASTSHCTTYVDSTYIDRNSYHREIKEIGSELK